MFIMWKVTLLEFTKFDVITFPGFLPFCYCFKSKTQNVKKQVIALIMYKCVFI